MSEPAPEPSQTFGLYITTEGVVTDAEGNPVTPSTYQEGPDSK